MRVTSKGQVTIPQAVRRELGIGPGSRVEFTVNGDHAELRPASSPMTRGQRIVARLSGTATRGRSTNEIMRMSRGED